VTTIVLYGDSMLGRYTRPRIEQLEQEVGPDALVINCAAGGWNSADGLRRAHLIGRIRPDVVVVSFGANDCRPDRQIAPERFEANVTAMVAALGDVPAIGFLPPSVAEQDGVGHGGRTNKVVAIYQELLAKAVQGRVLDTDAALSQMVANGIAVHEDGLHLNAEAYRRVTTELARTIKSTVAT
jgi:lysophospholipase L1-like esterase